MDWKIFPFTIFLVNVPSHYFFLSINIMNDNRHAGDDDGGSSSEDEEIISQFVMDIDKVNPQMQMGIPQQHHQHQQHLMHQQHQQLMEGQQHQQEAPIPTGPRTKRTKCNDLSAFTKWAIVARYMEEANRKTDRLYTGSLPELCAQFVVSKRTIQRIVYEYKTQIEKGIKVPDMTNKKVGRGADTKFTQEVADNIKKLKNKAKGRLTVRGMAEAYEAEYGQKISYMTLYRYDKRTNKAQKPIKYAKNSVPLGHPQHMHQQQQHQQASSSSSAGVGGYNVNMNHSDLAAAFAEADAVSAAGFHQHQMHNPAAHVFAQAAALPIPHMQQAPSATVPIQHH